MPAGGRAIPVQRVVMRRERWQMARAEVRSTCGRVEMTSAAVRAALRAVFGRIRHACRALEARVHIGFAEVQVTCAGELVTSMPMHRYRLRRCKPCQRRCRSVPRPVHVISPRGAVGRVEVRVSSAARQIRTARVPTT